MDMDTGGKNLMNIAKSLSIIDKNDNKSLSVPKENNRSIIGKTFNVLFNKKVIARDREDLKRLINERIALKGPNCSLNDIDVSNIRDFSRTV